MVSEKPDDGEFLISEDNAGLYYKSSLDISEENWSEDSELQYTANLPLNKSWEFSTKLINDITMNTPISWENYNTYTGLECLFRLQF